MLNNKTEHRHQIDLYIRYRDDILFLTTKMGATGGTGFLQQMQRHAGYFMLDLVCIQQANDNDNPATFLELQITKQGQRLKIGHHIKATTFRQPLHQSNCHHNAIHRWWPKCYAPRIRQSCSTLELAKTARSTILRNHRASCAGRMTLDSFESTCGLLMGESALRHTRHKHTTTDGSC